MAEPLHRGTSAYDNAQGFVPLGSSRQCGHNGAGMANDVVCLAAPLSASRHHLVPGACVLVFHPGVSWRSMMFPRPNLHFRTS